MFKMSNENQLITITGVGVILLVLFVFSCAVLEKNRERVDFLKTINQIEDLDALKEYFGVANYPKALIHCNTKEKIKKNLFAIALTNKYNEFIEDGCTEREATQETLRWIFYKVNER